MEQHVANEHHEENTQNREILERQSGPIHQFTPYFSVDAERVEEQGTQASETITKMGPNHQFTPQNGEVTSPYYGMSQTVQVPEYTIEQTMMQESIRTDAYGLLKRRESMKILCISLLIVLGMLLMFNLVTLIQLSIFGFVSGGSVRFLSTTELFVIRIFYIAFITIGSVGLVNQCMFFRKIGKIRAVSIPRFEAVANGSLLFATFCASFTLFLAAFWLMTSQTSYWMYFIFQSSIVFLAYLIIFLLLRKMDMILKSAKKHRIRRDNNPKAEIEYYKPVGYKTEVRYINR